MVLTQQVRNAMITASVVSAYTSDNWAGGIHEDKGRVTQASVDIVVPECSVGIPAYNYVPYSVSGWAGIDGSDSCNDVVLQAGMSFSQNKTRDHVLTRDQAFTALQNQLTTRLRHRTMPGLNGIQLPNRVTATSNCKRVIFSPSRSLQTRRRRDRHCFTTTVPGRKRRQATQTRQLPCA